MLKKENNALDIQYVKALHRGECYAFDYFFSKYAKHIYQFSKNYLKSEADAEEIVQQVFMNLWERKKSINPEQNFRSYLFKIAINVIRDSFNRMAKENQFKVELFDYMQEENMQAEEINFHLYLKIIDEQIELLPEKRKAIFVMHKKEGLTVSEIASVLNLSQKTVENQLTSAIKNIRNAFAQKNIDGLYLFFFDFFHPRIPKTHTLV